MFHPRYTDCAGPCQRADRKLYDVWFSWFGHPFPLNLCSKCQLMLVFYLLKGATLDKGRRVICYRRSERWR